jgi:gluconolactonase
MTLLLTACGSAPTATTATEAATESIPSQTPEAGTVSPSNPLPAFDFSVDLEPVAVAGSYGFAEGPAVDPDGSVYFSDITAGKIYKWSPDGSVSVFLEGLNGPNGLMFDRNGNLIACEGGAGRIVSIDPHGRITVLADQFNGLRFNEPNDLWIDPQGGIYFTDPAYQSPVVQDGQHVYYLSPDRSRVSRLITDLRQPNGIVGTGDGRTLYVADYSAGQTFRYDIHPDGSLSNKTLFIASGSDGMTLDAAGNVYLTTQNQVRIYDPAGTHLTDIPSGENPTNVEFAGPDRQVLFITARTTVYTIQMTGGGSGVAAESTPVASASGFTLTSPEVVEDGTLPAEYTCDGAASSLALAWNGAPAGTVSYAVIMHHVASPTDIHWYWVLYDIPAEVRGLPKNTAGIGTLGTNSVNDRNEYAPPCSKGPGPKTYTYTVYALSEEPQLSVPASQVDRATLLAAIQEITLASAELHVTYTRP